MTEAASSDSRAGLASVGRVEAFSDGVFAIAITLLVLELRPPETAGEFGRELLSQWPSYVAYIAAFAMVGSVWLHHHYVFQRVRLVDVGLMLTNLLLLLTVSVLPFPTSVLSSAWRVGDRHDRVVACLFFAALSVAISIAYLTLCGYASRHRELLSGDDAVGVLRGERKRGSIAILGTVIAAIVALASPVIALVLFAVTPVYYLTTLPRSMPSADGYADQGAGS